MRLIALFSDVHANLDALKAVLDDIDAAGVSERYCLGDLVGYGPDPNEVVDLIRSSGIPTIRGNYDEGIGGRLGACGCYYGTQQARDDGAASYEFTVAAVDDERAGWLAGLPDSVRLEEGGARVLLTHGSPRKINEYLLPDRTEEQLARLAERAGADVVCVGHVHIPYHRSFATERGVVHYVSSGSVGKPGDGDPWAAWVGLVLGSEEDVRAAAPEDAAAARVGDTATWAGAVVHRVGYDVEAVAGRMRGVGLPETLAEALRRA
ncbi:MAG: metallophosphoesterase family protein [Coriobacteriia bacterium]|nr:metallophosphoesterase family protein [Coriobacteriia bacterium]